MRKTHLIIYHVIHGLFLGFVIGLTISIIAYEYVPEIYGYFHPAKIYPVISILVGIIAFIKGMKNHAGLLSFIFSTVGTILIPIFMISFLYYLFGTDLFLSLAPQIFLLGLGIKGITMETGSILLIVIFIGGLFFSYLSSRTINKKRRWTW
ncbi:hypothetical protein Amet_2464 [Alkaliphilus metalliredigens QYMF]|uniref:Uncharacterized protein n=1 Tax=Alkaliphilus metalliredigens (strain QYMF) TaxID=293826 RepID=A6TR00_ALKMQ|nr:hypothetical protein [Alkaliphilus metalliredigens]ABR48618.1 hypothetical protein Amet_2464 [Alkaliphilus metalliredigens QYMF]